ncbi:MAG: SulP family inorganic anion transporter [Desulfobacteraceae bacterium]|nr:MAG: SulP family inorganic anion transporter [Desulfobacteraceae bacterium]
MHLHAEDFVPFVSWLHGYKRRFLRPDLLAGLTVAVMAVPQSMAYALIAGLPVQYGLYASIVPTIVGCLWGSSAHLITGPTTTVSLVVFSTLSALAEPNSTGYIELALFLSLLVGLIKVIMGFARLGTLLNFVSHAVLIGFMAGAAVLIAFKQIPNLLGLQLDQSSVFYRYLLGIISNLHETNWITLMLGVGTVGLIVTIRKLKPNWPSTLIALALVGLTVALFDLERRGVAVVGDIPRSLPPLHLPDMEGIRETGRLASGALAMAILGLVEAVSIAKSIASQTRQRLNINREFIGQGLANVAAGLFSGYPGSGSFTRSALNYSAGARTPLSGIISGVAVASVVLLAAPLAAKLPMSSLAGVLMVVAYEMIRKRDIIHTIKTTRGDAAVLTITFLSTLLLNIEFAIYVGVLLSIGLHLAATSHPRIYSMVPDLSTGKMVGSVHGETCCQMDILFIEGSIFFGSADFVLDDLQRRLRNHPNTANLLIRMHKVNTMDASGVHILEIVLEEVKLRGGGLFFAGVNHRVFDVLKNSGFLKEVDATHVRTSTGAAIRQAMRDYFYPSICAACPIIVFRECPELKRGNWEIFGEAVQPRMHTPEEARHLEALAAAPAAAAAAAETYKGKADA